MASCGLTRCHRPRHAHRPSGNQGLRRAAAIRRPRRGQLVTSGDRLKLRTGRPGQPQRPGEQPGRLLPRGLVDSSLKIADRSDAQPGCLGKPATFATAGEKSWQEAVRAAVAMAGIRPQDARFAVRMEFRVAAPRDGNEIWDLDNFIKPTLDAMEGVFGGRSRKGQPQAAGDRVDRLEVVKRSPHKGEPPGATIGVWVIPS
jgi:hypothetical protein